MYAWSPATSSATTAASKSQADADTAGKIEVGERAGNDPWPRRYSKSGGSVYFRQRDWPGEMQAMQMLVDFQQMVLQDGMDPKVVHAEFLKIDEYRDLVLPDLASMPALQKVVEFHRLVLDEGLSPYDVHSKFLKIPAYRSFMPYDLGGPHPDDPPDQIDAAD